MTIYSTKYFQRESFAIYGSAEVYKTFAKEYQFTHVTSSPYHPQSNGEAERAVGTIKRLLSKGKDPYLAILSYRSTPLQNGFSPSELLMNRKLRTTVPMTREQRKPKVPDQTLVRAREEEIKRNLKRNYDRRYGVRKLPELNPGDAVWIPDRKEEGMVQEEVAPRSYRVNTPEGTVRQTGESWCVPMVTLQTQTSRNSNCNPNLNRQMRLRKNR